jgi:hypothetical protein
MELTEKGSYYALLDHEDARNRIVEKSAFKYPYHSEKYRICGSNRRLFNVVLSVASRYRREENSKDNKGKVKEKPRNRDDKYVKRPIKESMRKAVWKHYNTYDVGKAPCFVCNETIDLMNYQCGHIISEKEGGEAVVKNLLPICGSCNRSMGTQNLFKYTSDNYSSSRCFDLSEYKVWKETEDFVNIEASLFRRENANVSESSSAPKVVIENSETFILEGNDRTNDKVRIFISEKCSLVPGSKVKVRDLHTEIKRYLRTTHAIVVHASDVKLMVSNLGYKTIKIGSHTYYNGISLNEQSN